MAAAPNKPIAKRTAPETSLESRYEGVRKRPRARFAAEIRDPFKSILAWLNKSMSPEDAARTNAAAAARANATAAARVYAAARAYAAVARCLRASKAKTNFLSIFLRFGRKMEGFTRLVRSSAPRPAALVAPLSPAIVPGQRIR